MELRNYLVILWRRIWVIALVVVVTQVFVIAGSSMMTPTFTSTATLRIAASSTGTVNYSDYMYADRLLNTYVKLATTKPVLDELLHQLELNKLPQVQVEIVPETELIQIKVEDSDPVLAAKIANTLAEILINQSMELYSGSGKSSQQILSEQLTKMEDEVNQAQKEYMDLVVQNPNDTQGIQAAKQTYDLKQEIYANLLAQYEQTRLREAVRANSISLVEPGIPAAAPSKPRLALNIVLGCLVGLVGGVGLAFLFENLDSAIYRTEDFEEVTRLPSLGTVPNGDFVGQAISLNGSNPYVEALRRVRTNLFTFNHDTPLRTLLVTSSVPGEGKSTLAANLAITLAQSGKKVVVVDCDLRLPTQHKIFNLPNKQGLSNVLVQQLNLENAIQESSIPGVQVITSGPKPRNPAELLGSPQMSAVINHLHQRFDTVLFDAPTLLGVTDAAVLASSVDGVILVVCRARSRREALRAACRQLADVRAHTLGIVVNRAELEGNYYYYNRKTTPLKK